MAVLRYVFTGTTAPVLARASGVAVTNVATAGCIFQDVTTSSENPREPMDEAMASRGYTFVEQDPQTTLVQATKTALGIV